MAELGKAYVQIVPSARGIEGSISKVLKGEAVSAGKSSGESVGTNLVSTLKHAVAAAGIGATISKAMSEGGALQQSIGGIQTLFKDYSDEMIKYANNAYQTAGLSANQYMEQVTSFSASLLQSLGGDTKAAGDAANQAVIDMADNANKMGTSMESIQNAYQGFAKQNYTMLDNLKLGYGGTKTEMQRLLADAEALTGVKYDINNLSDVYSAIHVIQDELGITNTTAEEAAGTFTGSMAAMKASILNLLGAMTTDGNVADEVKALIDTTRTFIINNAIPMLQTLFTSIPKAVTTALPLISEAVTELINTLMTTVSEKGPEFLSAASEMINNFLSGITEKLPDILDSGIQIIEGIATGIFENLPTIITVAGDMLNTFVNFILENLPTILEKGAELITFLANGISQNMPAILNAIGQVLMNLLQTIINHLPQILSAGVRLIVALVRGMLQILGSVRSAAGNIAQSALSKLLGFVGQMLSAGVRWISSVISGLISGAGRLASSAASIARQALNSFLSTNWVSVGSHIISGIVSGLWGAAGSLFSSLRNMASNALQAAKSALHIGSPSKLFRDEVGKWIPEGIAVGIDMNADTVDKAVADLANPKAFSLKSYNTVATDSRADRVDELIGLLNRWLPVMAETDIVLDDGVIVGRVNRKLGAMMG